LIQEIDPATIPERAFQHVRASGIVMRGELTGHAHRLTFTDDTETGTALLEDSGSAGEGGPDLYLDVHGAVDLTHEEHTAITLPEGSYRVIRQREYDEGQIRYVAD